MPRQRHQWGTRGSMFSNDGAESIVKHMLILRALEHGHKKGHWHFQAVIRTGVSTFSAPPCEMVKFHFHYNKYIRPMSAESLEGFASFRVIVLSHPRRLVSWGVNRKLKSY